MTDTSRAGRLAALGGVASGSATLSNGVIVVSLTRIATTTDLTAAALRSALGWASIAAVFVGVVCLFARVGDPGHVGAALTFTAAAGGMVVAAAAHGWVPMAIGLALTGPTVPMAARWRRAAMAICPDKVAKVAFEKRASWAAKVTRVAGALIGGPFLVWTGHWWMAAGVVASVLAVTGGLLSWWCPARVSRRQDADATGSVLMVLRSRRGQTALISLFCAALVYQYIWSTVEPDLTPGFGRWAPTLASAGVILHLLSGVPASAAAKHAGVAPHPAMRRASWGVVAAAAANTSAIALAIAGVTDRWMVLGEAGIRIGLAEAGYNMVQSAGRVVINRFGTAAALLSALAMAAGTATGSWVGAGPGRLGGLVPHWAGQLASALPHGMRTTTFEAALVLAVSGIAVLVGVPAPRRPARRRRLRWFRSSGGSASAGTLDLSTIPAFDAELVDRIERGRGEPPRYAIHFRPGRVRGGYAVCRVRFDQRPGVQVSAILDWHCFRARSTLRADGSAPPREVLGEAIGWARETLRAAGALDPPALGAGAGAPEHSALLAQARAIGPRDHPEVVEAVRQALALQLAYLISVPAHENDTWTQRRCRDLRRELRRLSPDAAGHDLAARRGQRPREEDS